MTGSGKTGAWPSGLVIVDKPGGITSHDVVARVRRLARTRRVGHAGTLDPMATGVLVIGIEKATRLLGHLMLTEKTYAATIRLGQATSTDDAEGEPTGGGSAAGVTAEALDDGIARLTGDILQVPPGVSAIKVNGERAYKLTRAGAAPELAARPVTVRQFSITGTRHDGGLLDVGAVVREGLTNVARHAGAAHAAVRVEATASELEIYISDDGHGIGDTRRRSGLDNLRRRAEEYGGALVNSSAPEMGTSLSWTIPLGGK